ncbi:ABC transporter permease [Clostridium saccharobutylicum]|nr:ABC transporter permease [Clostridium saccharobutylicum]MBA8980796.1 ABC-type transport system involved in multi-copper enzyme maturation permease subunit [Clostridium saccharobutylicum]
MVFPILLGAISFGNDFLDRTINNTVCAGHSRFQIFVCKVSAYFIGVNLVILFSPIVNVILNIILHRYTTVYFINEGNILAKTIITTSLLGMAMSSISIFAAFIFRDIGKTVGISVVIYFINISLLNSTNDIRTTIFRFLPLAQARLILYRPLIRNQFKEAGLIGIITILFFLSISYFCFKKTELR